MELVSHIFLQEAQIWDNPEEGKTLQMMFAGAARRIHHSVLSCIGKRRKNCDSKDGTVQSG